ncbi:DNA polymerase IV [Maridesulfovibrio salexigens]|uniref:DNA polymerase IV n=1 Tax=Maridesulfovibrio salexigens (strain ATCC 14822 / DSM 2638 / NCIMB 8403 / VKM B-1763) TaxID=526222 RepID=C6BW91_MARSD|nr:DNA polymerase IV [Maridesulfovibrio salexigens]ACS78335.1 DNA-directed DNA polymerase [Maridesulfovibrio salexigens DSM 2638]
MQKYIMHIDMDAFFASVEQLDNPELRGKPVGVGSMHERSVLSAASYEARKFGVRSAMPVRQALKLCPQLQVVSGSRHRYKEISRKVMAALSNYSPIVEQASIDEAYIDITGTEKLFGTPLQIARSIKADIRKATGLTASVGIAPVKFLAKIASDLNKPDGISIITAEQVQDFLKTLPVEKIPGVGKKALPRLRSYGITYAADLRRYPPEFWKERFGERGLVLYEKGAGIDPTPVTEGGAMKSSSAENTFGEDVSDIHTLKTLLLKQSERIAADIRKHGVKGRTVTLKVKFPDFRQITRSRTLDSRTSHAGTIYKTACSLLDAELPIGPIRLIGVGISNFEERNRQLSLLDDPEKPKESKRLEQLDKAVDQVRLKFGKDILTRGRLLEDE